MVSFIVLVNFGAYQGEYGFVVKTPTNCILQNFHFLSINSLMFDSCCPNYISLYVGKINFCDLALGSKGKQI